MFEIGWSELLVIGVVLIVVVGPKDLPRMLRTFGRATTQMRRMAGDFRRQFDEALREAELDEVRDTVRDIGRMDPRKNVRDALNPIRAVGDEIRSSLQSATKAPEPKVPDADAPAKPVDTAPPAMADATSVEPPKATPESEKAPAATKESV
jgi:sec-independent protein translocase protein TatB